MCLFLLAMSSGNTEPADNHKDYWAHRNCATIFIKIFGPTGTVQQHVGINIVRSIGIVQQHV